MGSVLKTFTFFNLISNVTLAHREETRRNNNNSNPNITQAYVGNMNSVILKHKARGLTEFK